jgi:hypothetical protein
MSLGIVMEPVKPTQRQTTLAHGAHSDHTLGSRPTSLLDRFTLNRDLLVITLLHFSYYRSPSAPRLGLS